MKEECIVERTLALGWSDDFAEMIMHFIICSRTPSPFQICNTTTTINCDKEHIHISDLMINNPFYKVKVITNYYQKKTVYHSRDRESVKWTQTEEPLQYYTYYYLFYSIKMANKLFSAVAVTGRDKY